jgi:lipopolysaccharide biosynthesis glycosyltransferase
MATTLLSVVDSAAGAPVELFVGSIDIAEPERLRIQRSVPDHPITWIDCSNEWLDEMPEAKSHKSHLARLNILQTLSTSIDRVIYMDADVFVAGNIAELWDIDLQGHVLGAVRCMWGLWMGRGQSTNFEQLELDGNRKYAQTGITLVDLVKWRQSSMLKRCEQYLFRFGTQVRLGDQEAINAVIDDDWLEVPIRWNVYADPSIGEAELIRCAFSRDALIEASERPGIVHFTGRHKPWNWSDPKRDSLTAVDEWERTAMRTSYADWYAAQREQGLIERAKIRPRRRSPFRRIRRAAGVLVRG